MIPAVWCIDVEPDEKAPGLGATPWLGFPAMAEFVEKLRARLAERSGFEFALTADYTE